MLVISEQKIYYLVNIFLKANKQTTTGLGVINKECVVPEVSSNTSSTDVSVMVSFWKNISPKCY